jgi:hypothetical protein
MRAVEAEWPAVGSRLFHASGVWPVTLRDETRVEELVAGERLVVTARGRPFGEVRVELHWRAEGDGTRVEMGETPVSGPAQWVHNPLSEAALVRRNVESLARLTALVERRTTP